MSDHNASLGSSTGGASTSQARPWQHGRERLVHNTSRPSSSASTHGLPQLRSVSPLMSRRAWQLQADEGLASAPYGSHPLRTSDHIAQHGTEQGGVSMATGVAPSARLLDTHADPPVYGSRLLQGRARAGTLPSSWANIVSNAEETTQEGRERSESSASRFLDIRPIGTDTGYRPRSSQNNNVGRWSNLTTSVPATPSEPETTDFAAELAHSQRRNTTSASVNPMALLRQISSASDMAGVLAQHQIPPSASLLNPSSHAIGKTSSATSASSSSFDLNANVSSSFQTGYGDLRARSSSHAEPTRGLGSNAFGPSIFTSTWADHAIGAPASASESTASRRSSLLAPVSNPSSSTTHETNKGLSFASEDFGPGGGVYEDTHVRDVKQSGGPTLGYLGVEQDENSLIGSGGVRFGSGLGAQRNRASTLAAMPTVPSSRLRGSREGPLQPTFGSAFGLHMPSTAENDQTTSQHEHYNAFGAPSTTSAALPGQSGHTLSVVGHGGRNRAGTVAALGGPGGRQRIERELLRMATAGNLSHLSSQDMNSLLASLDQMGLAEGAGMEGVDDLRASSVFNGAPLENFPYLDVSTPPPLSQRQSPFSTTPSTPTGRSRSQRDVSSFEEDLPFASSTSTGTTQATMARQSSAPNAAAVAAAAPTGTGQRDYNGAGVVNQTPSRSLWIGNLHAKVTGQELMHVFAPYGAIESLRLLPDKECGFVNFVDVADAVQARDDILDRLGARLDNFGTGPGGMVRIGFGKIDTVPGHGGASGNVSSSNNNNNNSNINNSRVGQPSSVSHVSSDEQSNSAVAAGVGASASDGNVPTRALWVGSIPSSVTPATLLSIFQPFGPVESARVLTHKSCGFVNFERVDDAVRARKMLNGREVLGSEVGAMRIGFAKVPTRNVEPYPAVGADPDVAVEHLSALHGAQNAPSTAEEQILYGSSSSNNGIENYRSNLAVHLLNGQQERLAQHQQSQQQQHQSHSQPRSSAVTGPTRGAGVSASNSIVPASDKGGVPLPAHMIPLASVNDLQLVMRELSFGDEDVEADVASVSDVRPLQTYYITIPLVSEVSSGRRFETARLRESRRAIESGQYTTFQCDQLALDYLESIVDLASDYIGNTLVQKFFEACSEEMKMEMLQRLAPHLAMVGCHKNGTWAAQKILSCVHSPDQIMLIGRHLRPYVPGLLLDSYGNYVIQCCLPWTKYNDFVFDAMVDRCWEIAQGRFGARSMRACLEDGNVAKVQRKRVAIAIILNSVPLATSPNGSILLTWLLESSGLVKSYLLLAPRFAPHLGHLCTHKLASSTVLRLITQDAEPDARRVILSALFEANDDDRTLEEVIVDQVHGSQFITKVLASSTLAVAQREQYAGQVKRLLIKHQLVGVPAYRRLSEDLGLTATASQSSSLVGAADLHFSGVGVGGLSVHGGPLAHTDALPVHGRPPPPHVHPMTFTASDNGQQPPHQQHVNRRTAQQQDLFNPFWNSSTAGSQQRGVRPPPASSSSSLRRPR